MRPSVTPADLRGIVSIAVDATVGVSRVAEGVHEAVWRTLGVAGAAPGRTRGLTGRVYASVRAITRLVGRSTDAGLRALPEGPLRPGERQTWRAVLNGVLGDHLAATGNPLAVPMALHLHGQPLLDETALDKTTLDETPPLDVPGATGRVLLLVHGLCMDDRAWRAAEPGARLHAETLSALGYTAVAVRYNTGLPIAENGRRLAALLAVLHARWPVPVREIAVVAHSMGGLVVRSATHQDVGSAWQQALARIAFLGTPHHGAPLERAGGWVDAALGLTRFSAPFAALGAVRSAGITDLRHGRVTPDGAALPLPADVACYAVAATLAARRTALADHLVGDGLVPLRSALGQHTDPRRALRFAAARTHVAHGLDHVALLRDPAVTQRLAAWFSAPVA